MGDVWGDDKEQENSKPVLSSVLTLDQLQKLQATQSSAHMEVDLCYSGEKAFVKPLKVNDKKEVLKAIESKNEALVNKVFDNILQKYVEFENTSTNYENITLQERFQLLTYIRTANGDKEASIAHQCPECNKVTKDITYDLSELHLKIYDGKSEDEVVVIPLDANNRVEILIKPLSRSDERTVEKYCKNEKIETMTERSMVYIAASIKKINVIIDNNKNSVDLSDFSKKVEYYKKLDGSTDDKIKEVVKRFDFGVKMPLDFTCSHCGYHEASDEVNVAVFFIS